MKPTFNDEYIQTCIDHLKEHGFLVKVKEGMAFGYLNGAKFMNESDKDVWIMMVEDSEDE